MSTNSERSVTVSIDLSNKIIERYRNEIDAFIKEILEQAEKLGMINFMSEKGFDDLGYYGTYDDEVFANEICRILKKEPYKFHTSYSISYYKPHNPMYAPYYRYVKIYVNRS